MINRYNERELAEYMLENGFKTREKFYELNVLAKYWLSEGIAPEMLKEQLTGFCERYFRDFNYVKYSRVLDTIIKRANKYPLVQIGSIDITCQELEVLDRVNSPKDKEVAFTLLCLYKINKTLKNNTFINNKINDLMRMSGVKNKNTFFENLRNCVAAGIIRVCVNGSIEWVCEVLQDTSAKAISVKDIDSCYLYYRNYLHGGYIECKECGKIIPNPTHYKYCPDCAAEKERARKRAFHQKRKS